MTAPDHRRSPCARLAPALMVVLLMGACSSGPDYVKPATDVPAAFKEGAPWKPAQPRDQDSRGAWWGIFKDARLDQLEDQVMISNQNIIAAEARFREARAVVQASRSGFFPQVGADSAATRSRSSASKGTAGAAKVADSYALGSEVSWELDLWGRVRRGVEASEAAAVAGAADLESLRLSSQTELALSYFQLRTVDAQRRLMATTVASNQQTLTLTRSLYAAGTVSRADVLLAETELRTSQAEAIELGVSRTHLEHAIAVLVGQPPARFSLAPVPLDSDPPPIPLSQPSELLERRPDIAAAERRIAEANARIGVAEAAYFPAITLSASAGLSAALLENWLTWPSRIWSLGTALTQTLFDGGLRTAQVDQAIAVYEAMIAAYRQTVLTGFLEVEDNLAALRILSDEARSQALALESARKSLSLSVSSYRSGLVGYLIVIIAQGKAQAAERNFIDIRGRRAAASVQLIKAMGGSWSSTVP